MTARMQDGNWQVAAGDGEAVSSEIEKLTAALARLTVEAAEEQIINNSDYELAVTAAGKTHYYRLYEQDDTHYISRDDYDQLFRVSKSDFEKITGQRATQLVKQSGDKEPQRDS